MKDIHNYNDKTKKALDNILTSNQVLDDNKEDIKEFLRYLEDRELSASRKMRYLQSAKQVMEYNDFRLKGASEEKVRELHRQIQRSAYYHKDYSPNTKAEYKKFLRTYYKWANGGQEVPDKADFIKLTVKESVKDRTNLPKPRDIKLMCQKLMSLRDKALLLTHWELGSRIGETLNLKVGDYYEKNGVKYLYVTGNKTSHNREARVILSEPAIDRWLEKEHPKPGDDDAYLFC
ncbi:MAG: hypothetical protein SVV03_04905, partial [Candidatus Nanohaloarchaea archaeon]|nr:hypothetical protein [Candidatus Nanohaloarchaea archaeon]